MAVSQFGWESSVPEGCHSEEPKATKNLPLSQSGSFASAQNDIRPKVQPRTVHTNKDTIPYMRAEIGASRLCLKSPLLNPTR